VEDIRAGRPYLLSTTPLKSALRRLVSIASLVTLDVGGLMLGVYGALALRALLFEPKPILWGVLWRDGAAHWIPFLALVTVLVFWRSGLYAPRELREGPGKILSSLVLVVVLAAAFGIGTGHDFGTFGIFPTALVLTTLAIATFRWSYESLTGNLLRVAGVRRRALLLGGGAQLAHLYEALGSSRGGIDYEFVGAVAASPDGVSVAVLGDLAALPRILATTELDELIVAGDGMADEQLLDVVEQAHRRGVAVRIAPRATQLLVDRAEYVPGQGVPLFELRPPAFAGTDWAIKRSFDLVVGSLIVLVGLPLWLLIAGAIRVTSKGPVAQVPHDGRGRRAPAARPRGGERGVGAAVQDPRGPARDAGRARPAALLDRRGAERAQRAARRDVARRPAAAAAARLRPARPVAPQALPRAARPDGPLADLRPLGADLRRPRPARLLLPGQLVDLARHRDPAEDAARGRHAARRLLGRNGSVPD
jgi:hypothetical protein